MTAEHGSVVDHHIVNCGKVLKSSHHLGQISLSLSLPPALPSIIPPCPLIYFHEKSDLYFDLFSIFFQLK